MQQLRPNLLVLDLGLPDSRGDMIGRLTRAALDGGVRILVCSAAGRTAAELAEKATADAYLTKPFNLDDLIGAVTRLLESEGYHVGEAEVAD
jgi:DNA-binding response OmpR family regulator